MADEFANWVDDDDLEHGGDGGLDYDDDDDDDGALDAIAEEAAEEANDPTYDPAKDASEDDDDGEDVGEVEEVEEEEEDGIDLEQEAQLEALEAARRKALSKRHSGPAAPAPAAAPASPAVTSTPTSLFGQSSFGSTPGVSAFGGGGGSVFGSAFGGAAEQPLFGTGSKGSAFIDASLFGTDSVTGGVSAFGSKTPAPSAFGSFGAAATSAPTSAFGAAPLSFTTRSKAKAVPAVTADPTPKPEKPVREKRKEKHTKGTATTLVTSMDSSSDSLMTRSKRFSNMGAAPLASSPSPDALSFRGGPDRSPPASAAASSSARSTANMMAMAMGGAGADSLDGDDGGELFSASNFKAIVGQCLLMCPLEEQAARQESRDLSYFEIIPGTGSKDHGDVPLVDSAKAVKKYKRAAAAQTLHAKDVRPPHILQQTMEYLVTQIMDRVDSPDPPPLPSFLVIYRFVSDRMRALRQDFVCQMQHDPIAIGCYEYMVRFHILTMFELGDLGNIEKFDPTPNVEKLSQTLTSLRHMFFDNFTNHAAKPFATPNEAEMHSYRLLIDLDRRFGTLYEELDKFDPAVKNSPIVQFCVAVYTAFRENNYARFFALARRAPYCHAVLLQGYFNKVRAKALEVMSAAYKQYPFDDFQHVLGFESPQHAAQFLEHYNIAHDGGPTIHLSRSVFEHPEGGAFPFRNSFTIVGAKRPKLISQAVRQAVGRGEGMGLEVGGSSASSSSASSTSFVRARTFVPKSSQPMPMPTSSLNPNRQFLGDPAAPLPTISSFGNSSFGNLGLPPPSSASVSSSFKMPSDAAMDNITTKPTKLNRSSATFTPSPSPPAPVLAPATTTFGSSALNPKAASFTPSFSPAVTTTTTLPSASAFPSMTSTFGTSSAIGGAFGTNAAALGGPVTAFGTTPAPQTTSASTATGASSTFSAFGSTSVFGGAPTTSFAPIVSAPKSQTLPPPSFGQLPPIPSTTTFGAMVTGAALTPPVKPPTPTTTAPAPLAHISGFQLPTAAAVAEKPEPAIAAPVPVVPSSSFSNPPPSSSTQSTFSGFAPVMVAPAAPTPVVTVQPRVVAPTPQQPVAHPRPPLPQQRPVESVAPQSVRPAPAAVPVKPVVVVKPRPPSPTPDQAQRMFLAALHQYKTSLQRSALTRWLSIHRERAAATARLEAQADAFQITKSFLRWHGRYAESVEYQLRFQAAQQTLHAPVSLVLHAHAHTPSKQQPQSSSALMLMPPSSTALALLPSPSRALAPPVLHAGCGGGLISPFAKLAVLGVIPPDHVELSDEVVAGLLYAADGDDGAYGEEEEYQDDEMDVESYDEDGQYQYAEGEEDAEGEEYTGVELDEYHEDDDATNGDAATFQSPSYHSPQQPTSSGPSFAPSSVSSSLPPFSPNKSGLKRARADAAADGAQAFTSPLMASPHRRGTSQQQPAAVFSPHPGFLYDDDSEGESEEKESQRVKLFHTPSRMAPRAVFSPEVDRSSGDLLQQLRAELQETSKLDDILASLENRYAPSPVKPPNPYRF